MFFYEQERSEEEYLYHQFDTNLNFPLHLHHSFELVYVEDGELLLTLDGGEYAVKSGEIAVIPPDRLHAYRTPVSATSYICIFSIDYCYDLYTLLLGKEPEHSVFLLRDPGNIARLCAPSRNIFEIKSALFAILGEFVSATAFVPRKEADSENLLERVVTWLQDHFSEPISMQDLADYTGYHYNYLSAWLHKNLGIGFRDLLNRYRVDLAADLLAHTSLSVTEIADGCGFETVRTFNRNFSALRGCSPSAFRKRNSVVSEM